MGRHTFTLVVKVDGGNLDEAREYLNGALAVGDDGQRITYHEVHDENMLAEPSLPALGCPDPGDPEDPVWLKARLEHLRGELRAERISWGELAELQSLASHIDPDDVELLEAAGVSEEDYERGRQARERYEASR